MGGVEHSLLVCATVLVVGNIASAVSFVDLVGAFGNLLAELLDLLCWAAQRERVAAGEAVVALLDTSTVVLPIET